MTQPTAPNSPITQIALVGHCGFDSGSLTRLANNAWPEASVIAVNTQAKLEDFRGPHCLLLINRVLDGRFDAADGIELIQNLTDGEAAPRMMLVSNYADAQASAVEAGALPGFGKNGLGDPAVTQQLRDAAV